MDDVEINQISPNNSERDEIVWTEIPSAISHGQKWVKTFCYNKNMEKSKCRLCDKQFTGCFIHNLKRHMCQKHVAEATLQHVTIKRKRKGCTDADSNVTSSKKAKTGKLSRGEYIKNCVLLAAVNMVAFLLFNSPFLRNLTLIHATSTRTTVNTSTIKHFINLTGKEIVKLVRSEVKNRLISIKLDIATRHYRSMLCVNVQFYCNIRKRISIRTLGCVELKRAHTSSYLEQRVYSLLDFYDIDRRNIYSYTSDNGANLLCLGKLIKRMQHDLNLSQQWEELKLASEDELDTDEDMAPDDDDDGDFEFEYNENMHAAIDNYTIDVLMKNLTGESCESPLAMLEVFGCAAHTVQLAVHDVLASLRSKTSIKHIRSVIKELKSSSYLDYNMSRFKSLKLNVCSRWNSLYKMFVSILKHEDDLKNLFSRVPKKLLPKIYLSAEDFNYMTKFNEAFDPIYKLTLALQSEQLAMSKYFSFNFFSAITIYPNLGDILVLWYKCKRDLNRLNKDDNEFVEPLIAAFDVRTATIMQNPLLATAAYVDPRLNHKTRSSDFLGDMKDIAEVKFYHNIVTNFTC